jgi:putative flippase GtrA
MRQPKKRDLKFIIFSAIGVFNTLFDLALYVVADNLTHSIVISNVLATSAALIGSYFLNSRLTFKSKKWTFKGFALFVVVTIFGLWFLQTGIIYALTPLLHHIPEHIWRKAGGFEHTFKIVVPKLLATAVTFIWNFLWYNKVIFKGESDIEQVAIALD